VHVTCSRHYTGTARVEAQDPDDAIQIVKNMTTPTLEEIWSEHEQYDTTWEVEDNEPELVEESDA